MHKTELSEVDFSSIIITSNPSEKFYPMNVIFNMAKISQKQVFFVSKNHGYDTTLQNLPIPNIRTCKNLQDLIFQLNLEKVPNIIIFEDLGEILLDEPEMCPKFLSRCKLDPLITIWAYIIPEDYELYLDLASDCFQTRFAFHNNFLSPAIVDIFGDTTKLTGANFLINSISPNTTNIEIYSGVSD